MANKYSNEVQPAGEEAMKPEPIEQAPAQQSIPASPVIAMMKPTPHEEKVAALAEKNAKIPPALYNVTSRNKSATRIIHDFYGEKVSIAPGETKRGIALQPQMAVFLGKSDLVVEGAAA
jgi:hypothetical protein